MNIFNAFSKFYAQIHFLRNFNLVKTKDAGLCVLLNLMVLVSEALGFASLYPVMAFIESGQAENEFASTNQLHAQLLYWHKFFGFEISVVSLMFITFALVSLRQALNYFAIIFNEKLKMQAGLNLGVLVVEKTLSSDSNYIGKTNRGDFIVTCDHECQAVATIVSIHIILFRLLVSFIAYFLVALLASPMPAFTSILIFLIISWLMSSFVQKAHRTGKLSVEIRRDFVHAISEIYGAWKVIKLYNTEEREAQRFSVFGKKFVDVRVKLAGISGLIQLVFVPAVLATLLSITYIMIEVMQLSIPVILIYTATMIRLMPISKDFQARFAMLAQYDPSLSKLRNVIMEADQNAEKINDGKKLVEFKTGIAFENVSFKYNSQENFTLNNVNIFLPKGKIISIVGRSGAGKSTFIDLITGIIRPIEGRVTVDNVPLEQYSLSSIRRNVAVVTQDTFLFNESIRDNLCYGSKVSDTKINEVLKLVGMSDFVSRLPLGLDSIVADSAKNLSGGQKQRFAIARAFIKNTPVIVLDEPTSALDKNSEAEIIRSLQFMCQRDEKTVIMVAHRPAASDVSDIIINIADGKAGVVTST